MPLTHGRSFCNSGTEFKIRIFLKFFGWEHEIRFATVNKLSSNDQLILKSYSMIFHLFMVLFSIFQFYAIKTILTENCYDFCKWKMTSQGGKIQIFNLFSYENSTIIQIEAIILLIFKTMIIVPFSFNQSNASILCLAENLA